VYILYLIHEDAFGRGRHYNIQHENFLAKGRMNLDSLDGKAD
jgi:hypothetical protein